MTEDPRFRFPIKIHVTYDGRKFGLVDLERGLERNANLSVGDEVGVYTLQTVAVVKKILESKPWNEDP